MSTLRLSFTLLVLLGFLCVGNSNVISGLLGKSSNDKTEEEEKTTVSTSTASTAKSGVEATATAMTTPLAETSCGGLKGFLHLCEKNEAVDPPKSVKTRSVAEKDSDDSSDSDESDDSDDSDEKPVKKTTEKEVVKREAEDPETSEAPEEPPMVGAVVAPAEEVAPEEKRETEDSDSSEETEDDRRRRRDCRDRDGDYSKDCRRKREYVPSNVDRPRNAEKTTAVSA